jgi:hypothetical protein
MESGIMVDKNARSVASNNLKYYETKKNNLEKIIHLDVNSKCCLYPCFLFNHAIIQLNDAQN